MFKIFGSGSNSLTKFFGAKKKKRNNKERSKKIRVQEPVQVQVQSLDQVPISVQTSEQVHGPVPVKPVIGKIYAEWCGHCKNLLPIWTEMKREIQTNFPDKYDFSEIEEQQQIDGFNKIKMDYDIDLKSEGYPTIFKIVNGNIEYYKGARDKELLVKWFVGGNKGGKRKTMKKRK